MWLWNGLLAWLAPFKISCLQTNIEEGFLEQLNADTITDLMTCVGGRRIYRFARQACA